MHWESTTSFEWNDHSGAIICMPIKSSNTSCTISRPHKAMHPNHSIGHNSLFVKKGKSSASPQERFHLPHDKSPMHIRVHSLDAGEAEINRKSFDILPQYFDIRTTWNSKLKVFQLLALFGLNLKANLNHPVQELRDLRPMLLVATTRGHGRRTNTHTTRRKRGCIAMNTIPVERDRDSIANLLDLSAGQAVRPKIPKDQMVVGAITCELMALGH